MKRLRELLVLSVYAERFAVAETRLKVCHFPEMPRTETGQRVS
jgi:hypothetical protein